MAMGEADAEVMVGVLGRIGATVDGRQIDLGGPRQQALLAALASQPGRRVTNDFLIDVIWDGAPPDGATRTFRSYVARLRRAFDRAGAQGAMVVLTDSAGYRLHDDVAVDARCFEDEAARAREQLAAGEVDVAVRLVAHALDRWEGPAFGPFADREWAMPSAVRLEELRVGAAVLHARALLDAGRESAAVPVLEELAVTEPFRETVARLHAIALYRSGRDVDAVRVLREFRDRLVEQHGLDPSEQLAEVQSMILNRDPRLDRPVGGRGLRGLILHEPIARSPLGTVHRAEQPSIGREVAVTLLAPELADDPDVIRDFEARLQAVAGLDHPHVFPVYDYWREPGGAYVVTRMPASTLDQALRSGRMTADDALRVGEQVASALAAAHERGVVHGDVGIGAVVLDERGDAHLWSFPLTADHRLPADDVARLATMVTDVVSDTLTTPVEGVLSRAVDPAGGPVVTAAKLALVLSAARTGVHHLPAVPVEIGPNPYRGLAAFRETDADVFFGRESLTERLLARVRRDRVVAVVGPSGCGKSSVVRAGVLPRLRAEGGFVTSMVPGVRPLAELEIALSRVSAVELVNPADEVVASPDGLDRLVRRVLPRPGADLVLLVDQAEELFTLADPTERDLFLDALAHVVADHRSPIRVVVTLRADFLAAALSHPVAGPLVRDRSVMVGPLDRDDLHEVIVRPAELAGVAVEPALAVALVADAARAEGALPMVQFALTEVFAAGREDGLMTAEAYRRLGGIDGVLGQRAEEVFATLDDGGQRAARSLFLRLLVPHDDAPPTRRRALRRELERIPDAVVEAFGRARLLRFDHEGRTREPTVEITHEALFRAWPRLAGWIADGIEDIRLLRHLTAAAAEWDSGGREDAELYRGSRLDTAAEFAQSGRADLSSTELAFLAASQRRRVVDEAAVRRTVRRLRALTSGLAVGLVITLLAGTYAWTASRRESEARRREQATARSAQVDELAFAASGELAEDPERASLLAAHAYSMEPDLESQAALLDVLGVEPRILSIRPTPFDTCSERTGTGEEVLFTRVSLQGEVFELRTLDQEVVRTFVPEPSSTSSCAGLTPSGDHVLVRHVDRYEVLDLDLRPVATRGDVLSPDDQRSLDFHPTRPEAALVLDTGAVAVVSVPELETLRVPDVDLDGTTGSAGQASQSGPGSAGPDDDLVRAVAYSEDASLLSVADVDTVHVVDDTGALVASMAADPHPSGRAYPYVSAGAGVFGHLAARSLVVAPLDDPMAKGAVDLHGVPSPYRRAVAVEPGGRRAAVATSSGIEVIDLLDRVTVGEPIPVDANIVDLFWSSPGRLNGLGPNGVHQMEVDRSLLLGALVEVPSLGVDAVVEAVASDASGVIVFDPPTSAVTWVDAESGTEVSLGPTALADALPGRRWFALDPTEGTAATGDVGGVDASAEVDALGDGEWNVWSLEASADRVVALLRGAGPSEGAADRSAVVVFDVRTAEPLQDIRPPEGVTYTAALPFVEGGVLVADNQYRWTVLDASGDVIDGPRVLGTGQEVAAVDHEGGRYVTADWNGDLHVVDPAGDVVVDLPGPASFAMDVAFADADRLVSRHIDGSTYLWDVPAGRLVGRLWRSPPFGFFVMGVDRQDGVLVQLTPAGVARIPLDPDEWFATVCSRVDRALTAAEIAAIAPGLEAGPGCPARPR